MTQDNIGGAVKEDEHNILERLQTYEGLIEGATNSLLARHPIKLPEFQVIDYTVKFDYQDAALGTGIMVTKK